MKTEPNITIGTRVAFARAFLVSTGQYTGWRPFARAEVGNMSNTQDEISRLQHMSRIEAEIRRRIRIAVWAYAYEVKADPFVTDAEYDEECRRVNLALDTSYEGRDNSEIDAWFRDNFSPDTGQWIWRHPNLPRIASMYEQQSRKSA